MSYKISLRIKEITGDHISFFLPVEPAYRLRLLKYLDKQPAMVVDLSKIRKKRSTGEKSQNHHLNGHIGDIMKACGMTTKKEYDQVKTEIKRIAHYTFGYPADKTGHFFLSEAEANSEQCSWLIEAAHLLASDLGVILTESF